MKIPINPEVSAIISQVEAIVSPIYLVGGGVRDVLLGRQPHDYDFATPLSPDEIETQLRKSGKRPQIIGRKYGTVGFKIDGQFVEVTTFRTERYSPGSRKPEVEFINDITHDLSRRDFTINAMALRPDGTLVDPFDGQNDLSNSYIRTVNKPYDRYNEDPLRMLRAARFAAQLNFAVDNDAKDQAAKKADKILEISKERWTLELDKLLTSDHPDAGLQFLADTRLLYFMLPELAVQIGYPQDSPYHELDLWSHTIKTVCLTENDTALRWAALLHDVGKPYTRIKNKQGYSNYVHHEKVGAELAGKIGTYLKWPKLRTDAVHDIVLHHLEEESPLHDADSRARFK